MRGSRSISTNASASFAIWAAIAALILRNHGLLTVGRSVAEAFSLMFYLNLACEVQVATLSMGAELVVPPSGGLREGRQAI